LTDVDHVCLHFGKPEEEALQEITVSEAKTYLAEGHFPVGSMAPKIRACIAFVENGGEYAIITSIEKATLSLSGNAGTRIAPDKKD
jgi:carbamate kinase